MNIFLLFHLEAINTKAEHKGNRESVDSSGVKKAKLEVIEEGEKRTTQKKEKSEDST